MEVLFSQLHLSCFTGFWKRLKNEFHKWHFITKSPNDEREPEFSSAFNKMRILVTCPEKPLWVVCLSLSNLFPLESNLINPSHPDPGRTEKSNLNFYFRTSLWCLKRFYGFKGLHKTIWGTTKKCENKNLS